MISFNSLMIVRANDEPDHLRRLLGMGCVPDPRFHHLGSHCVRPARVAGRKGHSFILFFLFSLLFFPAALITAYVVRPRRG